MILSDLHNLAFDFCLVSVNLIISTSDFFCLFLLLFNIHSGSILLDIFLAEFLLKFCNRVTDHISLITIFFNRFLHFHKIILQLTYFCFQLFDLTTSSKQVAVVSERTTCHGTTRT